MQVLSIDIVDRHTTETTVTYLPMHTDYAVLIVTFTADSVLIILFPYSGLYHVYVLDDMIAILSKYHISVIAFERGISGSESHAHTYFLMLASSKLYTYMLYTPM